MQAKRMFDLKNEDKANPYTSHNTRYTKTKERPAMIQQSMNAEIRMTRARYNEGLLSTQRCGGDEQHGEGKDHQPHDKPDKEAALVDDTGVGPSGGILRGGQEESADGPHRGRSHTHR